MDQILIKHSSSDHHINKNLQKKNLLLLKMSSLIYYFTPNRWTKRFNP